MRVYLDHNSTSPLRDEARQRWLEVALELRGNPSSTHAAGRRARSIIDEARERVAAALGVREDEIFFTSGATESNNVALFGVLEAAGPGSGLVTTSVEHSSILAPARELAALGHPLVLVGVDACGVPDPAALVSAAARAPTALVALAAANSETGARPDLPAIRSGLEDLSGPRPLLHVDAVQALGRVPVRLAEWGASLASFSSHKIGGPSGVGILWRRAGVSLRPRFFGGGQELELRPGTEDVPGIAAAALAVELAVREQAELAARTLDLAGWLWRELQRALPSLRLLGPPLDSAQRLPNTLCVLVPGTDGKVLVTRLDLEGLEVSAGSACTSGSVEPSHVLLAMGLRADEARAGLRLSLGRTTSRSDCKRALDVFHKLFAPSHATRVCDSRP